MFSVAACAISTGGALSFGSKFVVLSIAGVWGAGAAGVGAAGVAFGEATGAEGGDFLGRGLVADTVGVIGMAGAGAATLRVKNPAVESTLGLCTVCSQPMDCGSPTSIRPCTQTTTPVSNASLRNVRSEVVMAGSVSQCANRVKMPP